MIDFIDHATRYAQGLALGDFQRDRRTRDAVERNLILLGEASRHVPEALQAHYRDHPWRYLADMRNRLVHDYRRIDGAIVWGVVTLHLSPLRDALFSMLADVEGAA
jgi:uncharacterized protein with HEPN domain